MLRSTILGKDHSVEGSPLGPQNSHLLMWLLDVHPGLKTEGHMREGERETERGGVGKEERLRETHRDAKRNREAEKNKQRWRER